MNIFKIRLLLIAIVSTSLFSHLSAQQQLSDLRWTRVATGMPDSWYGSDESIKVAENILLYQRNIGGWPKNIEKHKPLSEEDKARLLKEKSLNDAIFDNSATTTEMRFLARMYSKTGRQEYLESFSKGLKFILDAQYENGGWPMFWPLRKGYYTHITYNDNAIVNILRLLRDIIEGKAYLRGIAGPALAEKAAAAYRKGIDIILKTQIISGGRPTVWCAQHDEFTLLPAKARSYELPSFSGGESAGIVLFLMEISEPAPEIISSVNNAVNWFENNRIRNVRLEEFVTSDGKKDRKLVSDPMAGDMWARFYDLETGKPFFCDRDGIKKNSMDEIGHERRNGYSWYTDAPQEVLDKYPEWKKKNTR